MMVEGDDATDRLIDSGSAVIVDRSETKNEIREIGFEIFEFVIYPVCDFRRLGRRNC